MSEQHRILLAGLESQLPPGQAHAVLFTAPKPGMGTTTVLLNLALTLSLRGRMRVAVVDANFERPAVAERLGLADGVGLRDILRGIIAPQRALRDSGQDGLRVVTVGQSKETGLETLGSDVLRSLLRYLRGRFEWVLVDGPCWDGSRELGTLANHCDAVYLVLPQSLADGAAIEELQQSVAKQGGRLRGCILTDRPRAA